MKTTLFFLTVIPLLGIVTCNLKCDHIDPEVPDVWLTMVHSCKNRMREQVQNELVAAMTYLAMGSHFSKYDVNRPGFAKFFFDSASEEREHAIKIISYLLMRTDATEYLPNLINSPLPKETIWNSGVEALESALKLEASVTVNIRNIIKDCEAGKLKNGTDADFNDYHLVDYLSGDFLEEQYKGQRELAGMISTLKKMIGAQGILGEYLFDKKLLNNELF